MRKKIEEYKDDELFYMLCDDKKIAEMAFSELYARYSGRVYAYCLRFLGNSDDAQDVFQETFAKLHQSASKSRDMTNVPGFILRIARNLCVNHKRKDKAVEISFEEYMVASDEGNDDKKELLNLIKYAITKLPEEYREMFILREYDGMSYADIAEITGVPMTTVKVRLFRAKKKVREILAPYLQDLSNYG